MSPSTSPDHLTVYRLGIFIYRHVFCSKFYVVVLEAWHSHSEEVRNKSVVSSESLKTIAAVSPFCSSNENCMKCCVLLVYNQLYK